MAQVLRHLPLVQEVWGSNPEPIRSLTRCQRLTTAATLMYEPWHKVAETLVTPERVISKYNDLIPVWVGHILFQKCKVTF